MCISCHLSVSLNNTKTILSSEMVNGTGTSNFTMRLVRSKLRKREDHLDSTGPINSTEKNEAERDDLAETTISSKTTDNCNAITKEHQHVTFVRTSGVGAPAPSSSVGHKDVTNLAEWTFPPKAPAPHIYHINPVR